MSSSHELAPLAGLAVIAAVFAVTYLGRQRRGYTAFDVSPTAWAGFAAARGLTLFPSPERPVVSGDIRGVAVRISAELIPDRTQTRQTGLQMFGRNRYRRGTYVSTELQAAFRAVLPAGLQLRPQTVIGAIVEQMVADGEITIGDAAIDRAFLIQGHDPHEIAAFLAIPEIRSCLLALHATGYALTVDEHLVKVVVPQYLTDSTALDTLTDALVSVVEAAQAILPSTHAPVPAPPPPASTGNTPLPHPVIAAKRQPLQHLLSHASRSASAHTAIDTESMVTGRPCQFDLEVERVAPYTSRVGRPDGRLVSGLLIGGTARVDVHFPEAYEVAAGKLKKGDRIAAQGYVDQFDPRRDHVELTADSNPEPSSRPRPGV